MPQVEVDHAVLDVGLVGTVNEVEAEGRSTQGRRQAVDGRFYSPEREARGAEDAQHARVAHGFDHFRGSDAVGHRAGHAGELQPVRFTKLWVPEVVQAQRCGVAHDGAVALVESHIGPETCLPSHGHRSPKSRLSYFIAAQHVNRPSNVRDALAQSVRAGQHVGYVPRPSAQHGGSRLDRSGRLAGSTSPVRRRSCQRAHSVSSRLFEPGALREPNLSVLTRGCDPCKRFLHNRIGRATVLSLPRHECLHKYVLRCALRWR